MSVSTTDYRNNSVGEPNMREHMVSSALSLYVIVPKSPQLPPRYLQPCQHATSNQRWEGAPLAHKVE
jgi:hypothetical protein